MIVNDEVDMVPCTFETPLRRQFGDFAAFLYRTRLEGVRAKKNHKVRTTADLKRHDVSVLVAKHEIGWDFAAMWLKMHADKLPRVQQSDPDRVEDMMDSVAAGTYDVAIADALSCRKFLKKYPQRVSLLFSEAQEVPMVVYVGTLIPKGDQEYKKWVDEAFEEARRHPAIQLAETQALQDAIGAFARF